MFHHFCTKDVMKPISKDFFLRKDVVQIAKDLLGKIIITNIDGQETSGRIVETEAYMAFTDRAAHSFKGRRTARNEAMYQSGGTSYVYLCYGLHNMLNIVTNVVDVPDAVLIRALEPLNGLEIMMRRTGKNQRDRSITKGPGNVAKAVGVHRKHSGMSFLDCKELMIMDDGLRYLEEIIGVSERIGINGSAEAIHYPYRFFVKNNPFVSGKPNK